MSEIDQLKEELKQARLAYQMAAQMSHFKAGFLARTSHELRSPLSSMIGLHQLILSDLCESPEEQKEFITQAYHSALKLMKLIDEIVAVSKTEYGSNSLNLESLKLGSIFAEVKRLTHLQAANRNLKLEIADPAPEISVFADRSRLTQLIFNLIDSGVALMKYGKIEMSTTDVTVDFVRLEIDLECPAASWQDGNILEAERRSVPPSPYLGANELETIGDRPLEAAQIRQALQEISLSANMRLQMSKTLIETMGGSLEFKEVYHPNQEQFFSKIILNCKRSI